MTEGNEARKGFVTIATGKDEYYVLAHNLLLSYRYFSISPMPFAIICDRENDYTSDFDTIVLMDNPQCSVFDKLRLPELAPFDETIFIEADCLAYRDLNDMWAIFEEGPDFGTLGTVLPLESKSGWIQPEFLGKYRDRVQKQYLHQGGVYYMRKGHLDGFIRTCQDIYLHREEYHFRLPNEEPIYTLACMLHGFPPVKDWCDVFCFYPDVTVTRLNIKRGQVAFTAPYRPRSVPNLFLVHWGTNNTRDALYKREADTITALVRQGKAPVTIRIRAGFLLLEERVSELVKTLISDVKQFVPMKFKVFFWRLFHPSKEVKVS